MKRIVLNLLIVVSLCMSGCQESERTLSGLCSKDFSKMISGKETGLYRLVNESGMEVCITNYGGRIVSVMVPDRKGNMQDVVLGFDNIDDYCRIQTDFGATIGRYANRISGGVFELDGQTYHLPVNNFGHCLHGGPEGWQYKVFDVLHYEDDSLTLGLVSPDGDSNFPGTVRVQVNFTLTEDNSIDISYKAATDKPTIINMTNHSYFNLSGNPSSPATDHVLYLNAESFTPVDSTFMTTGEILAVSGTPMDFTIPKTISEDIDKEYVQLANGRGYDHNWVLNTEGDSGILAASLFCPKSGIKLEVFTDEPGIQVYTGNFLDGTVKGKKGIIYGNRASVCLETQHYPDSPNKPQWPSVVLEPGETYTSSCTYRFSVAD